MGPAVPPLGPFVRHPFVQGVADVRPRMRLPAVNNQYHNHQVDFAARGFGALRVRLQPPVPVYRPRYRVMTVIK